MAEDARARFVTKLEDAANRIGDVPRHELQILLRRTALRLRNSDGLALDPGVADKFAEVARLTGVGQGELASLIIRDWLVANGYLPFHDIDEDTEPDGAA